MTLYEQYKEDTKPHPFLKNKGHVKILMKKAYLNSIDCMIATHKNKQEYVGGKNSRYYLCDEIITYLNQQRDLIANEL